MPTTATTRNYAARPAAGELGNAWGPVVVEGTFDVFDWALDGISSFTLSGSKTLTVTNFVQCEANARTLNITGGTGGTITIPNTEKLRFVRNASSGDVIITTGSGTTATVPAGALGIVYSFGGNVVRSFLGSGASRDKAAVTDLYAWTADKVLTADLVGSAFAPVALAYASTLAWDWRGGIYRGPVTCTGNVQIGTPTNIRAGESRQIELKGDGATARTVTFSSAFLGDLPTISDMTSTRRYRLIITADSSNNLSVAAERIS